MDDAILQQTSVAKERGDLKTAISLFRGLTTIKNSELRGEGQFGIAECYEQMALDAGEGKGQGYFEQAFRAYQGVYENLSGKRTGWGCRREDGQLLLQEERLPPGD